MPSRGAVGDRLRAIWRGGAHVASHSGHPRIVLLLELAAVDTSVRIARNEVSGLARDCGLDPQTVDDVRLAVSETVTNAIVHGSRTGATIVVRAYRTPGNLIVEVVDRGPDGAAAHRPGAGLGLTMIAALTTSLDVTRAGEGTRLTLRFRRAALDASSRPRREAEE